MKIDDNIRDENGNMVLTEKQQKYQHYHPKKLMKKIKEKNK